MIDKLYVAKTTAIPTNTKISIIIYFSIFSTPSFLYYNKYK